MEKYIRASKKQLEYIDLLTDTLHVPNPTLYTKFSMFKATKLIDSLKRKIAKQKSVDRQIKLL